MFRILLAHHQGVHYKTTPINVHLLVEILTTSINVVGGNMGVETNLKFLFSPVLKAKH